MKSVHEIHWHRILAEGAVIVASILAAFWIDAWWDESQQREREVIVLRTLLGDVQEMRARVDGDRRYNEAILESSTILLRAATGAEHDLTPEDIDRLIRDIVWFNAASRWESVSIDLIVSAGDLARFSNVILVQKLGLLHRRLERVRQTYRLDEAFYRDKMTPFLGANANLPQIFSGLEHAPGLPDLSYDFPDIDVANADDHSGLLSNTEFQGLLTAKIDLQIEILVRALGGLGDHLDEIVLLLEDEIDK